MLNETIEGISQKLRQVFGDGYEIYLDEMKQGQKEPCFFIACLGGKQQQELGNLYKREQAFDLRYLPKEKSSTAEAYSTADVLNMEMEYIMVEGNLVRGTKMRHEVIDGVLHFFVNYDLRLRKVVEPAPLMEELTIKEKVKTNGN